MALRVFHPCQWHFDDQDIRVAGATVSGGVSLSGIEDIIRTDSGGYWLADFGNADFGDRDAAGRAETLSWRAVNAGMLGGSVPVVVQFCDRFHQPVLDVTKVPHSDQTPFSDRSLYQSGGASATVAAVQNGQAGGNRATVIEIAPVFGQSLIGGERFTHVHATWGERAYEVYSVEPVEGGGLRLTFQPPIRGGIAIGDELDFDNVRCRMRRISEPSNPLNMGVFSSASISFREDMVPPA